MNINVQIEIPDEFFGSIKTEDIIRFLINNRFTESESPENHLKAYKRDETMVYFVQTSPTVEDIFYFLRTYSIMACSDFLQVIQFFGWGKCQTCKYLCTLHNNPISDNSYGDCDYIGTQIDRLIDTSDFGCIHYKFRSAT